MLKNIYIYPRAYPTRLLKTGDKTSTQRDERLRLAAYRGQDQECTSLEIQPVQTLSPVSQTQTQTHATGAREVINGSSFSFTFTNHAHTCVHNQPPAAVILIYIHFGSGFFSFLSRL